MKTISAILALAGVATLLPVNAQSAAPLRMKAKVCSSAVAGGRPVDLLVLSVHGNTVQVAQNATSQEIHNVPLNSCKVLYIYETPDLVEALSLVDDRKYQDARAKLSAVAKKYAATLDAPDSPSARAYIAELECAVCMMDWKEVRTLANAFPVKKKNLTPKLQNDLEIAKMLGLIAEKKFDEIKTMAASMKALPKLTPIQQARIKYALGACAMMAGEWNGALDNLAECFVLLHGSNPDMGSAVLQRMLDCYLQMKDVTEFSKDPVVSAVIDTYKVKADTLLADNYMAKRPLNIREGAAVFALHKSYYPAVTLPEKYAVFAISYKAPEPPKEEKAAAEAPAQPQSAPAK